MAKKIITTLIFSAFYFFSFAQSTLEYTNPDILFNEGREFYDLKKYGASYRNFEEYLKTANPLNESMKIQAKYYLAANAYELRQTDAAKQLENYLSENPITPYFDQVHYMLGMLDYEERHYKPALNHFRVVDDSHLTNEQEIDFLFTKGYALLETGDDAKALTIFKSLQQIPDADYNKATYYAGYTEYKVGKYDEALNDLSKIENLPEYSSTAPYYITQIYFSKGDYNTVEKRSDELINKYPGNTNNGELYRLVGEIAFSKSDYKKAAAYLKGYEQIYPKMIRQDEYYLGVSLLKTDQPKEALKYLAAVTTKQDELSESAYLQLGNAYVKLGDFTNARLVYESALQTKFNSQVREEALYNYALTTYDTTTAFGESIRAFEQFLQEFPNSKHTNDAYNYLADIYLTTKNYNEAYESISKITNLNSKLKETKQYIEYKLGTQFFESGNYNNALEYFTKAQQTSPQGKYMADIYYWKAESNYRMRNYPDAISDLKRFYSQPKVSANANYAQSLYTMGYAYFSQKNYTEAMNWFIKYTNAENNKSDKSYADALNRIGDGYFYQRSFTNATKYYDLAAKASPASGDYGLFQSAYTDGLQKNYKQKIDKLNELLKKYPRSDYSDDAMYEIARSYLMLQQNEKAVAAYHDLIVNYPNSVIAPKAILETGMVYYNEGDNDYAIDEFKNVINNYPASDEAKTALESLENIYVDKGDVNSYLTYIKSLGMDMSQASVAHQDSLLFTVAERQYMANDTLKAINSLKAYIDKFCPNGYFCSNAYEYLGDIYYKNNQMNKALAVYDAVLNTQGSPYAEQAALRAASISFDQKNYANAMKYFKLLDKYAQTTENKNIARLGVLRSSYYLNNDEQTISIAGEILKDGASTQEMRNEALFNRAKAYERENKPTDELNDLLKMSINTKTATGAEAKYMLANTYYKLNRLNEAEKEVLSFAKLNTPYQYWLAKSFVVLADVYVQKGNDFQAKQYLLSLQKNYTVKDDIQNMIVSRLNAIANRAN